MTDVRKIDVDYIARVEGEGEMHVKVVDGVIEDVWLCCAFQVQNASSD